MQCKLLNAKPETTYALVLERGDDVVSTIEGFAREQGLTAARLTAIGAFSAATLGYFDRARKDCERIRVDEQVEVLSLIGDIALADDEPKLHAHVVLGRRDGSTCGGHLLDAKVWPTLEVMLVESPRHLQRRIDAASGLALIAPRVATMVAAQGFGAAIGNIVCPHNIVAGAATVGLAGREAEILRRTLLPCAAYLALGGALVALMVARATG
jgi:predicted DNA-binding protein with PD1-like motif